MRYVEDIAGLGMADAEEAGEKPGDHAERRQTGLGCGNGCVHRRYLTSASAAADSSSAGSDAHSAA